MREDPLDEYLAGVDDEAGETLRALDAAIRAAAPELELAIKYRMPTYTLERTWRQWVRPPCRVPPRACEWRGAGGSSYCSTTPSASCGPAPRR